MKTFFASKGQNTVAFFTTCLPKEGFYFDFHCYCEREGVTEIIKQPDALWLPGWPPVLKFAPLRSGCRRLLRRYPWLPLACFGGIALALFLSLAAEAPKSTLFFAVACVGAAFATGYAMRMTGEWPRLHEFRRSQYAEVWDALSGTRKAAAESATGVSGEHDLQVSGTQVARHIAHAAGVNDSDDVLEIGSGVGRVGWAMAPLSRSWTGCDISSKMLSHAADRLVRLSNARLIHLKASNLSEIEDASVDVVYCTNALPHFSQTERWQYVLDAYRILRPRGRLYIDSVALNSSDGWAMVMNSREQRMNGVDLPYAPWPSTPDELIAYFVKAGFEGPRCECNGSLVAVIGVKPPPCAVA